MFIKYFSKVQRNIKKILIRDLIEEQTLLRDVFCKFQNWFRLDICLSLFIIINMFWNSDSYLKHLFRATRFFWLAFALLAGALLVEKSGSDKSNQHVNVHQISRKVDRIQSMMKEDMEFIEGLLKEADFEFLMQEYDTYIEELTRRDDYSIYIFEKDSLVFWSDNAMPVLSSFDSNRFRNGLFLMSNSWGICQLISLHDYDLVGIVPLQRNYPYENDFLSNDFIMGSGLASKFQVMDSLDSAAIAIQDNQGKDLFYLEPALDESVMPTKDLLAIIFYILCIISVLLLIQDLFVFGTKNWKTNWWLVGLAADLILLRWLMIKFEWPGVLYETSLFAPFENGTFFFNSQGDLILSGIFIFLFAYHFKHVFSLYPESIQKKGLEVNPRVIDSFSTLGWVFILLSFFGMTWLFEHILSERDSLIEVYKVLTINASSLSDLFFFILILFAFTFIVRSVIWQLVPHYSPYRFALIFLVTMLVVFVFSRLLGFVPPTLGLVLFMILVAIFSYSVYKGKSRFNHSSSVLVIIIGSIFLIHLFYTTNQEKKFLVQRQLLENLANEHDLIAEMLFTSIDREIIEDKDLASLVLNPAVSENTILSYLKFNYFGFYWNRYDIIANICDSINLVTITLENREESCLNFFDSPINEVGRLLPGTGFYYLDNFDGIINYRGKYPFYNQDSSYVSHLFITLDSRLLSQELGYPDLLISGSINRQDSLIQGYSYAKYQEGKLVSKAGKYSYSTNCGNYPEEIDRIVSFPEDGYEHLIYKLNPYQTIILSSPKFRLWDHLVSFSYVFVLLYLVWLFAFSVYYFPTQMNRPDRGLKQKIEFVMVGVLLVSFILIGGGMSYYIVDQYDKTNRNTIAEKTQSVLIELHHKLNDERFLSPQWSAGDYPSLEDLLVKFSYVFKSDINLFDPQGEILASSRPEIFDRQLVGRKMDPTAFHELHVHNQMEFIHFERIGEMRYWSAYVPFYNGYNELVAYLNLPYFAKQSIIRQEISTFIIAILNAYFLLIFLAVVMAVFLSNQVTKPLRILQEKFTKMELGGIKQTVEYHKKDEIGSLVIAYNRMVDELELSADKLAKSERETAWREMAKQIAHEIKNPLTPMKLSIQHLQRAWDDKVEDWEVYFDRVNQTLVEQIDSLSSIADEFAQFARMPQSKLKAVNFVKKAQKSIDLFMLSETGKIEILETIGEDIQVYMDEKQLLQVFNNLLKNAFQSVPKGIKPEIKVRIWVEGNRVMLSVQDNGGGIMPEISDKLFQPNFTTKTSGMGLGLAISKSIIESAGGKIWYQTSQDEGSIFFISLPVYSG